MVYGEEEERRERKEKGGGGVGLGFPRIDTPTLHIAARDGLFVLVKLRAM